MSTPLAIHSKHHLILPAEASAKRTFFSQAEGWIWQYQSSPQEFEQYLACYEKMRTSWPLPAIINTDSKECLIIMQFAGERRLNMQANAFIYERAYLHLLQGHKCVLPTAFTPETIVYENSLFFDWFLEKALPESGVSPTWNGYFEDKHREWFASVPYVAVHKDFHSANLLQDNQGKIFFIDYQDACLGPYCYDAISLIEDAYADVPYKIGHLVLSECQRQASYYGRNMESDYLIGAQQRIMKMVGIFTRLTLRDGKDRYFTYIPRLLKRLADLTFIPREKEFFNNIISLFHERYLKQAPLNLKKN